MNFTRKFDRAFQWAGEKIGHDGNKTTMGDDFKALETEMALRHEGMDHLHKTMNAYIKSLSRRGEPGDDKEKGLPVSLLGRTMVHHGEDFPNDSDFSSCLIAMGQTNERISGIQETYIANASATWLESLERSLAMMKEYQSARKKLESRRLAYDASMSKMQKAKREDFRIEDDLRMAKAKYEESSEDVYRRMQDIKEAESDSVRDLTGFLDAELDHYERCAEELRRLRQNWPVDSPASSSGNYNGNGNGNGGSPPSSRRVGRSNTLNPRTTNDAPQSSPVRLPLRTERSAHNPHTLSTRPSFTRSSTYSAGTEIHASYSPSASSREPPPLPVASSETIRKSPMPAPCVESMRQNLRPTVTRVSDSYAGDDPSTSSSPEYERSDSPATSYGSLSRTGSHCGFGAGNGNMGNGVVNGGKKAPPPPPPSRAKKPPPPVPQKRDVTY